MPCGVRFSQSLALLLFAFFIFNNSAQAILCTHYLSAGLTREALLMLALDSEAQVTESSEFIEVRFPDPLQRPKAQVLEETLEIFGIKGLSLVETPSFETILYVPILELLEEELPPKRK